MKTISSSHYDHKSTVSLYIVGLLSIFPRLYSSLQILFIFSASLKVNLKRVVSIYAFSTFSLPPFFPIDFNQGFLFDIPLKHLCSSHFVLILQNPIGNSLSSFYPDLQQLTRFATPSCCHFHLQASKLYPIIVSMAGWNNLGNDICD